MMRSPSRPAIALGVALLGGAALALVWLGSRGTAWSAGDAGEAPWPDPPLFQLQAGSERAYAVEVRSDSSLDVNRDRGEAAGGTFSLEAHGVLALKAYPGTGGAVDVGARLVEPRVTVNGQTPSFAGALDVPFSFHMDRQGRFTAIAFPPGLPGEAAAFLEQVLVRLQVVLPRRRQTSWRTRERDAAGIFRAAYSVSQGRPLSIEKRKLEYVPVEDESSEAEVVESRATFELEPGLRGVREVTGAEVLRRRTGYASGKESLRFRFQLTEAPPSLPGSFSELARRREAARVEVARAGGDATLPIVISGVRSAGDALTRFGSLFREDRSAAEALVSAWLRHRPGAPGELVRLLDVMGQDPARASLGAAERSVLWRLLAQAGTGEAERALLDAAVSPAHPVLTRRQAIMHFSQVPVARPSMVEGLLALYDARDQASAPEAADLGSMALLAVGALGDRSLASPEVTRSVSEALQDRFARATGDAGRLEVLTAMGNAGDSSLLPVLSAELVDPDPGLRAAAVGAFRRMEAAEARPALLAHAAVETDATVRARAIQVLERLEPDRDVIAWASAEAGHERDPRVLLPLIDLLGASCERSPEARQALHGILQTSDDPSVKRRVLRHVPPTVHMSGGR